MGQDAGHINTVRVETGTGGTADVIELTGVAGIWSHTDSAITYLFKRPLIGMCGKPGGRPKEAGSVQRARRTAGNSVRGAGQRRR
jgi:hypothetical protein